MSRGESSISAESSVTVYWKSYASYPDIIMHSENANS